MTPQEDTEAVAFVLSPAARNAQEPRIDLQNLISILRRKGRLILVITLLLAIVSVFIATLIPKSFTATAELLINPPRQTLVDVEALEQKAISQSFVDSQVELIKSRATLKAAADQADLTQHAVFAGSANGETARAGILTIAYWMQLFGFESNEQRSSEASKKPIDYLAVQFVQSHMSVRRVAITDIVRIDVTTTARDLSAALANAIAASYLERDRANRLASIDDASDWLDGQMSGLQEQVVADERAVEAYRAQHGLVASHGASMTGEKRAQINAEIVATQTRLTEAKARLDNVRQLLSGGGDVETIAEVLSAKTIADLRRQEAQGTRRMAELRARYGERHPAVVHLRAELTDVASQIEAEADRIIANLSNEVAVIAARFKALEKAQRDLEDIAAQEDAARIDLRELERRAAASRQLYETLLEGYQTSFVAGNADALSPAALLVTPATAPLRATFPNRTLFAVIGGLFGAALASAYALLSHVLDTRVQALSLMQSRTGLSPLVSLPQLSGDMNQPGRLADHMVYSQTSHFAESVKRLRNAFDGARGPKRSGQRILVTSALPSEGKTSTAIALAISYALAGHRTVLVDLDLRRPSLHHRLMADLPQSYLVPTLNNGTAIKPALSKGPAGLDLLLNDLIPLDPAETAGSAALTALLDELATGYDKVIIDSAPVLPVVDTALLAKSVDHMAMCVLWNKTPGPAVSQARQILVDANAPLLGGILTNVDVNMAHQYVRAAGFDDLRYARHYGRYYEAG